MYNLLTSAEFKALKSPSLPHSLLKTLQEWMEITQPSEEEQELLGDESQFRKVTQLLLNYMKQLSNVEYI